MAETEPPQPIGNRVASGYAWMTGQAVIAKAISLAGQIVLARLLEPSDFGLIGLALMVAALVSTVQSAGITEVLIQRFAHWRRWVTPGFWISVVFGLMAALLLGAAAPLVARACHEPQLTHLILILAAALPFDALSMIPGISLQGSMRFPLLAKLEVARVAVVTALSIVLACFGVGAASFILPMFIVAVLRAAVLWGLAHPKVRMRLQLGRWKYILKDSRLIVGVNIANALVAQGDYMMLGLLHSKDVVGVYFFSFGLSSQAIAILVGKLSEVLLPALSHLQVDPQRQTQAFFRATRLVAMIAFPSCLLQAALAGPIMRLLFGGKWTAAIPVFAVLSIGMISSVVAAPAWSLLQAQGRFTTAFRYSFVRAIVFLFVVWVAAKMGGALSVAIAVAAFLWVGGPSLIYIAVRGRGVSVMAMLKMHLLPLGLSVAALAPALLLGWLIRWKMPDAPMQIFKMRIGLNDLAYAATVAACDLTLYIAFFRWAAPQEFAELLDRLRPLLSGLRPR